jgi:hypothetical protein
MRALRSAACARRGRARRSLRRRSGPFDPLLHGWASREPVTGAHDGAIATGGLFRPFALVDGKAAAVWSLREGRPELTPLRRLTAAEYAALAAEAADVVRFLSAG